MLHEAWASTPPRPPPSEWGAGSDTDGSPLPTPPRVSHVYDLHDHEDTRPSTPHTLRRYRADTPNDATCRPSRHPPPQTPMVSSLSRSMASQRSVGRDLHKLRSSVRTGSMHIPARRVQRYQDDEDVTHEKDELLQGPSQDRPEDGPAAPAPEDEARAFDYLQLMWEEAERQHQAGFVPSNPHHQKSMAKETTFRGCRFIKVRRAGEGGFSTVWQVHGPVAIPAAVPDAEPDAVRMESVDERQQGYFAMKQVSLRRLEPESRDELVQEAQLLEQLAQKPGHEQYILRYFGHRLNRDTLKILLELGDMDFSHILKAQAPLSRVQICEYWQQMLEAVHFIHEKGNLVHTDLKPANFLMAKGRLKLIDFGIAQKIPIGTIHISREAIIGTPNYMAPEAIKIAKAHGRRVYKAGKASDVWSLGCILYQMVYGRPPFDRLSGEKKLEAIMDPAHDIPFPPHRVLDDPTSEPVDAPMLEALTTSLRYDAQTRAQIPALLGSELFHHHLGETVTISRKTLRALVVRLQQHAIQGELTDTNAIQRADVGARPVLPRHGHDPPRSWECGPMPDAQGRRRVLIAAYLLPKTIEFQPDEEQEADESATERTYSPPTQQGTSHTEKLAHQLTSSLMEAIDKEQARSRVLAGRPGRVSSTMSSSPRQALSAPRDRVNMAELMADAAAGTKPSYVQRSSSSITSYEVDMEKRRSEKAPQEVKSSLSDHGRRASAQGELDTSQTTPPRSIPPPVSSTSSTSPLPIPISIISDLEAKSHQGTASAPTPTENPYGLGSSTPVASVRSSAATSSSTPRLMEHPPLAPGWTDGIEDLHTTLKPNAAPPPRGPTPASTEGAVRDEERRTNTVWRFNIARPALRSRSKRFSPSQQSIPFEFLPSPGANHGLFNAVNSAGTQVASKSVYVGTLGIEMDWLSTHMRDEIDAKAMDQHKCLPVWLKDDDYVHCYHHYCKQILWPTFHYTQPSAQTLETEHDAFHAYVKVNQSFADRIVAEYREGDVIWIHDYHLLLVPAMVRAALPRAPIGLFVHIAFPSSEIFRCLSRRVELLRGMLGADLIGFQTHNFFQHFRQTVSRILQLPTTSRGIILQRSFVTVAPFPIGIDVRVLNQRRQHPDVREWVAKLKERFAGMRVIVGRDKLDWIKGVREKLLAFELFLDQHPEWVGRVVLVQVALATVQENHEVGDVSDIVSRINRKHSSLTYQPVVFLHVNEITFSQYLALLTMADAFVATSLREGMNLTSHEYVIAQEERKRPLILSEFTGAYSALRACIGINPFHAQQVAQAIERALTMDEDEMAQRWMDLHRTVVSQTAEHWVLSVLSQLERAHLSQPSPNTMFTPRLEIGQMQAEWRVAGTRLVLLSLEHTLVWEDAKQLHEHGFEPPAELVGVLRRLTADPHNYVYVLSRKSTTDLDQLARAVPALGIIAENGCYAQHCTRAPDGACEWMSLVDGIDMKWREPVRNILDYFTERTPGAWIEERSTTITWYFCEGTTNQQDVAWARRQASEVQSLITDSLGERFSLRMINENTHFVIMPKNVGFTPAVQYMLALDNMGSLPVRQGTPGKALFEFVLYIGHDEKLISHLNHVDLPFAPRTCTTARPDTIAGSIASCQLEPGKQVLDALEEIVDLHLRDLKWGGPAMMDV